MELIKCPNCGESYYRENYSTTTCLGWTPIYKNGVLMNENPNVNDIHPAEISMCMSMELSGFKK